MRVYRYDPDKVWRRIVAGVLARGGNAITPHGMRHSFVSNLLQARVPEAFITRWVGHTDSSLLYERYGHLIAYHQDINLMKIDGPQRPAVVAIRPQQHQSEHSVLNQMWVDANVA